MPAFPSEKRPTFLLQPLREAPHILAPAPEKGHMLLLIQGALS